MRRIDKAERVVVRVTLFALTTVGAVHVVAVAVSELLKVIGSLR
jgi:hypothetical protein